MSEYTCWFTPENQTADIIYKKNPIAIQPYITWHLEYKGKAYKYQVLWGFHAQKGFKCTPEALLEWLALDETPEWAKGEE